MYMNIVRVRTPCLAEHLAAWRVFGRSIPKAATAALPRIRHGFVDC